MKVVAGETAPNADGTNAVKSNSLAGLAIPNAFPAATAVFPADRPLNATRATPVAAYRQVSPSTVPHAPEAVMPGAAEIGANALRMEVDAGGSKADADETTRDPLRLEADALQTTSVSFGTARVVVQGA
jgi:hypothetical protein